MKNQDINTELNELEIEDINLVNGAGGALIGVPGALPPTGPINGGGPLPVGPNPFG